MEFLKKISGAFDASCREYKRILDAKFEPWSNEERLSIHETNQVANFLFAYKDLNKDCITWHELSIPYMKDGKNKTNHVDGFIIDGNNVVFIEAKRFSRVKTKEEELRQDLTNIVKLSDSEREQFKMRLPNGLSNGYKFYCLLLADFWANRNMNADDSSDVSINWGDIVSKYVSEYKKDDEIKLRLPEEEKKSEYVWGKYNLYYALFELKNF